MCPEPFCQLYTVHVDLGSGIKTNNVVPTVYGLLPNKTLNTYVRFFTLLKEKLGINNTHYKCDYEVAAMNAVISVFPDAKIFGCLFHYQKAVIAKAKELGVYNSREGRKFIRLIKNLPLLPAENIWEGWTSILSITQINDEVKEFKKYFLKYWLNKYPLDLLSCSTNKHRTTNIVEGWHRRFKSKIQKGPTLFNFIRKIKKEATHQDYRNSQTKFVFLYKLWTP